MTQHNDFEWHVYLLLCRDSTLYCGIAKNVTKRLEQHNAGKGARYTRGRGPVQLAWATETALSHSDALRLERRIKAMNRQEKEALIVQTTLHVSRLERTD